MAVIHVDGEKYEVNGADNLLKACLSLGLDVPYFCWHPAMGSVGSCRQCAVKQYKNKEDCDAGKGMLVMSCMVAPNDDMYISIDDEEAKAFRASMIELAMTNHPHDCPTCEEGGHCHLQDMTYMSGHKQREYRFTKRTHENQDLGPFVAHEMNRCIACYRCVRYYKDYAGGDDLGVYASASRVYFGRDADGQFESEFSGNLTEVCPTGVFTDKTHSERYNRKWDMQYAPSICTGCAVGCNISAGERYGELRRIENRYNGDVNGYFLCDRGRFGYGFVNRSDRPLQGIEKINDKQVKISIDYALDESIKRLQGKKIVGIGSPRASLETNFALKELVGAENFSTGLNQEQTDLIGSCAQILQTDGVYNPSVREIEDYDAVLVLGENITQTAPRIALAVRQAAKNKAKAMAEALKTPTWLAEPVARIGQNQLSPIFIVDVCATKLDDIAAQKCVATPQEIADFGFDIADAVAALTDLDNQLPTEAALESPDQLAKHIAQTLAAAEKPLIISGTGLFNAHIIEAAAQISQSLNRLRQTWHEQATEVANAKAAQQAAQALENNETDDNVPAAVELPEPPQPVGTYLVVPDVNSLGVYLLGGQPVEALMDGDYNAVLVAENQLTDALTQTQLAQFLDNKTVIALDHQFLAWHKNVDLLLPAASFAEGDGTVVSAEGRAQRYFQVYDPSYYQPNSTVKDGWRWLHALKTSLAGEAVDWTHLDDVIKALVAKNEQLAGIIDAAPLADYRIKGLKVAREPRRYSGRTAIRAPLSVHEPKQPVDADTALTFSQEGYTGEETQGALIPFAWAAGWNSPQAWNKFQDEVGGHLKQGDAGVRLFDKVAKLEAAPFLKPAHSEQQDLQLVPLYDLYGSSPMASRSTLVRSQLKPACFTINVNQANRWQAQAGDVLTLNVAGTELSLPVVVTSYLPEGCVGFAMGQVDIISPNVPVSFATVTKAPSLTQPAEQLAVGGN